jgi:hypothetical protein
MLCWLCNLAAQLDAKIDGGKMKHYSCCQDFIESAKVGCEICAAVVLGIGEQLS